MQRQALDSSAPPRGAGSHTDDAVAPEFDGWTASGLRKLLGEPLPPVGAEMLVQAGAIVVERMVDEKAGRAKMEATMRRVLCQVDALLGMAHPATEVRA